MNLDRWILITDYLIYLDQKIKQLKGEIREDGLRLIYFYENRKHPEFKDTKSENLKIFEWIEEESIMKNELPAENESLKEKLQKYQEIEEEFGIDLIMLFKAMKQGHIWAKNAYGKLECVRDYSLNYNTYGYWFLSIGEGLLDVVDLEDYGKTWALTKEELE